MNYKINDEDIKKVLDNFLDQITNYYKENKSCNNDDIIKNLKMDAVKSLLADGLYRSILGKELVEHLFNIISNEINNYISNNLK